MPDFEFRPSRYGNPEGTLIVFDKKNKSFCYEYYYATRRDLFICSNCTRKKRHVTAKVHFDEKNEKFIELSSNEHVCELTKDEFPNRVINASYFMTISRQDGIKRVIIFTSEAKEFYYELRYMPSIDTFECQSCRKLKKVVSVKKYTKKNGEEYLLKLKNEHICNPKKYDKKTFKQ
uniref:Uncharacterized protein n=1 Tax=Panagrolaimus sp. ES5 TaxID=591445 RepID=A0AC34FUS0_9BILA